MNKVGILIGHCGKGTGAHSARRDEWQEAWRDGNRLYGILKKEGMIKPIFISLDEKSHPWNLMGNYLSGRNNIEVRAAWAIREQVDAVVELHINSSFASSVEGHEIFIKRLPGPKTQRLGRILIEGLNTLGNRNRGLKHKSFLILRRLHAANIPAVIVEPAFINELSRLSTEWRGNYVKALKEALYNFFNL